MSESYNFYIVITLLIILMILFWLIKRKFFEIQSIKKNLSSEKVLFEIKIPKEVTRTPLAMESVLSSLHLAGGESNWYQKNILGSRRTYMSLEIVSIGGQVKFYIWAEKKLEKVIQTAFYSEYPAVELIEVLDYTKFYAFDPQKQSLFGIEYKLAKSSIYPIKTYKNFKSESIGSDLEDSIYPISHTLEVMENIGPKEKMWLQIVIRAQKEDYTESLKFKDVFKKMKFTQKFNWEKEAEDVIETIRMVQDKPEENFKRLDSSYEKSVIDSIYLNISKPSFWTGIRVVYFADKKDFNPSNIGAIAGIFNIIKDERMNNLNAGGFVTAFDHPWNDYKDERKMNKIKKDFFADYKRRKYFVESEIIKPRFSFLFSSKKKKYNDFIMNTEGLATIFHLPPTTIVLSSFDRQESRKGFPPLNLPF